MNFAYDSVFRRVYRLIVLTCIGQVFLVVEPKLEWDTEAVKRRDRAVKRAQIATAELFRTSPLDDGDDASAAASASMEGQLRACCIP